MPLSWDTPCDKCHNGILCYRGDVACAEIIWHSMILEHYSTEQRIKHVNSPVNLFQSLKCTTILLINIIYCTTLFIGDSSSVMLSNQSKQFNHLEVGTKM